MKFRVILLTSLLALPAAADCRDDLSAFVLGAVKKEEKRIMDYQEHILDIHYAHLPQLTTAPVDDSGVYYAQTQLITLTTNIPAEVPCERIAQIMPAVFAHEVGHFYLDERARKLGGQLTLDKTLLARKSIGNQNIQSIIVEGVAEYFARIIYPRAQIFTDQDWPKTIEGWNQQIGVDPHLVLYEGGYCLVKPLLDAYKSRAIDYLVMRPPTESDMLDLPAYRKKALDTLKP